ncbi:PREDICTED: uncharacterized protein LOC106815216 isoform X2 [Priapulus caudatus]|uniref:Uncharacterized protein LOC106815216 isoform X1 n=1 Tax=Priapulus caudatus TaxID=37621 RepID=A0ABM1ESF9_PRICU|nr:PREDICTED: uncharacterized protein LOC106815216 isoform X1 [Priapulus caudatus]XP_014675131.1 PREDICTED: uncharacterized protein LOC106815216 isoform X2 [Priapulus caudatus]
MGMSFGPESFADLGMYGSRTEETSEVRSEVGETREARSEVRSEVGETREARSEVRSEVAEMRHEEVSMYYSCTDQGAPRGIDPHQGAPVDIPDITVTQHRPEPGFRLGFRRRPPRLG